MFTTAVKTAEVPSNAPAATYSFNTTDCCAQGFEFPKCRARRRDGQPEEHIFVQEDSCACTFARVQTYRKHVRARIAPGALLPEVGLDKGEEFWIKKGLDLPNMDPMDPNMPTNNGMMPYMMPGMVPAYEHSEEHSAKLAEIEELLRQKLKTEDRGAAQIVS